METLPEKPNLTIAQVILRTSLWSLAIAAMMAASILLTGCVYLSSAELAANRCTGYGYTDGTPAYRDCIAAESRARRTGLVVRRASRHDIHHAPAPAAVPSYRLALPPALPPSTTVPAMCSTPISATSSLIASSIAACS